MKYFFVLTLLLLFSCKTSIEIDQPAPDLKVVYEASALEPSFLSIQTELALKPYLLEAEGSLDKKFSGAEEPLRAHEIISVFYSKSPTYNPQMVEGVSYNKGVRKEQTDNDVYGSFKQVEVKSDGFRFPRSVQYFKTAEFEGGFHKTQKPVALLEYLIKTYTQEGETVLDFTMGSGTTGVACVNTKRKFIGVERDDKYFDISVKRIRGVK